MVGVNEIACEKGFLLKVSSLAIVLVWLHRLF